VAPSGAPLQQTAAGNLVRAQVFEGYDAIRECVEELSLVVGQFSADCLVVGELAVAGVELEGLVRFVDQLDCVPVSQPVLPRLAQPEQGIQGVGQPPGQLPLLLVLLPQLDLRGLWLDRAHSRDLEYTLESICSLRGLTNATMGQSQKKEVRQNVWKEIQMLVYDATHSFYVNYTK